MTKTQYESIKIDSFDKVDLYLDELFDNRELVGFPFDKPSELEAKEDYSAISKLNCKNLLVEGEWSSKFDYDNNDKKINLYLDFNNVGMKVSNHGTFESRMWCGHQRHRSPIESWNNKEYFKTLIMSLLSMEIYYPTRQNLKSSIVNRQYVASQFRVSSAKAIYQLFESKNVLDFCSGWGDRLVGALSTPNVETYTGVDPNESLIEGYKTISSFGDKEVNMICSCAEDVKYDKKFDFVFTSPPYFNAERYSLSETQSYKKFSKIEDWKSNFLFRSIENAIDSMTGDGIMVINIADFHPGGGKDRRVFICDDMVEHLKTVGMYYLGVIGYRLAVRPGKNQIKGGIICEPMWVFGKKDMDLKSYLISKSVNKYQTCFFD